MTRLEALQLLTILTRSITTDEEKRIAALQLKELICLLLPDDN